MGQVRKSGKHTALLMGRGVGMFASICSFALIKPLLQAALPSFGMLLSGQQRRLASSQPLNSFSSKSLEQCSHG